MPKEFKKEAVEIIISTMNRSELTFLDTMFPDRHFSNYTILIINQTSSENLLISDWDKVRVINSFEKGLSKSRNLGLKNAQGELLVLADDDEVFVQDFDSVICKAYNANSNAVCICFRVTNLQGKLFRNYPKNRIDNPKILDLFTVFSPEITINRTILEEYKIRYDENFGLGATFKMGEEAVFLTDLQFKKAKIVLEPQVIAAHPAFTTTDKINVSEKYFVQGAFLSRVINVTYLKQLALKVFFDVKQKKIKISEIFHVIAAANKGRKTYFQVKN